MTAYAYSLIQAMIDFLNGHRVHTYADIGIIHSILDTGWFNLLSV